MPELIDRYDTQERIGEGVYGIVYRVREIRTGDTLAVKRIRLDDDTEDGVPAYLIREVSLLRDINHPNIVRLKDLSVSASGPVPHFHLIFEYVETDLHHVLRSYRHNSQFMPMSELRQYAGQLLAGIHACHARRIVHRDLKPQNVLVDRSLRLKIADFGLARIFSVPMKTYTHDVVTLWYRAPEILLGSQMYGPHVDMWSAGCIIAEMISGVPTFPGDSEVGTIMRIFKTCGTPSESSWPGVSELTYFKSAFPSWPSTNLADIYARRPELDELARNLLQSLLVCNPRGRCNAFRAKDHAFFGPPAVAPGSVLPSQAIATCGYPVWTRCGLKDQLEVACGA